MKAEYISHYLTDNDVANAARLSFAKLAIYFTDEQNAKLVQFLARGMQSGDWEDLIKQIQGFSSMPSTRQDAHDLAVYLRKIPEHWVPFGHPHITLKMQAPSPIRVQCFKHKIGFTESEESRRYISSTPEIYIPDFFRAKAASAKQGSGDIHPSNDIWMNAYKDVTKEAVLLYEDMIADGVCPEQARFVLPQGAQVNWIWTGSLYAYSNFFNQRTDSHAQKEIQNLAKDVGEIIEPLFPVSWKALTQGVY